jgi:hypothetical protein
MDKYDEARIRMLKRYESMINEDYSTLWEHWVKAEGTSNHAWSGGPLVIMSKYFAGIRPLEAGYSEFIIKPQLTGIDKINCVVPSVKGYITVTGSKTDNGFVLDASVPKGTTAYICIPCTGSQAVNLNGSVIYKDNTVSDTDSVAFVEAGDGYVEFAVKSSKNTHLLFEAAG